MWGMFQDIDILLLSHSESYWYETLHCQILFNTYLNAVEENDPGGFWLWEMREPVCKRHYSATIVSLL